MESQYRHFEDEDVPFDSKSDDEDVFDLLKGTKEVS